MAKKKLIIFPCNGNGIEALDCVDPEKYDFVGFVDDDPEKESKGYDIYTRAILQQYSELCVLAVPGSPTSYGMRRELIRSLGLEGSGRFVSVVHPSAQVGKSVQIGYNCLIMAGAVLTSNASVGNHVCVLPNTVVHHDAKIGDYSLVGSNVVVAGGVHIGENCYVGSGSNIRNGISIGSGALIGLGSNVVKRVAPGACVAGNPAKALYNEIILHQ